MVHRSFSSFVAAFGSDAYASRSHATILSGNVNHAIIKWWEVSAIAVLRASCRLRLVGFLRLRNLLLLSCRDIFVHSIF